MSAHRIRTPLELAAVFVGPPLAILVAWLLTLGGEGDRGRLTLANAALVMAVITVGVALIDWLAGITTSITAALALNYFHTEPYRTLRVTDSRDIWSIALLGVLGLMVSAVTALRVRRNIRLIRAGDAVVAGHHITELVAEDHAAGQVWSNAISTPANDLGLVLARVESSLPSGLPTIGRPKTAELTDHDLVLPQYGAALRLDKRHAEGRWLVLTPRDRLGPLTLDRRAVMAFATTVELALDPTDVGPSATTGAVS
jgi:hypothetical protein